jgi:hypothetical protein
MLRQTLFTPGEKMKARKLKQKIAERLAEGKCGASLVLAGFSSIYACRSEPRIC